MSRAVPAARRVPHALRAPCRPLPPLTPPLPPPTPTPGRARSTFKRAKDSPFFVFFYVDDEVCAARGRGGGVAFWARTTPAWELQAGVV